MAGSAFSPVGSPPFNEDLNSVQDWELLSASTLLAQGHGLGFGLPPLTTPVLHSSRIEDEGVFRRDADSEGELGFIFRSKDGSSLPLDVSQITSTSSVEPFTEGWKPQFRIAGAPLQENYYNPDPFAPASSNNGGSLEPFLDMEQSFLIEPPISRDTKISNPLSADKKQKFHRANYAEQLMKDAVSVQQHKRSEQDHVAQKGENETPLANSEALDLSKANHRNSCNAQNMGFWRKSLGLFNRKSYVTWSVALTTVLLGVFFLTYYSQSERPDLVHELSTGDEASSASK